MYCTAVQYIEENIQKDTFNTMDHAEYHVPRRIRQLLFFKVVS